MTKLALPLVAVAALLALALPSAASAQATRTWVSGVGDDANPCSRTAPCRSWQGAINKTAAGGEINAIDSGSFGVVNITKSLTIDGNGRFAGISACGFSYGVNVDAGASAKVTLRDLRMNGCRSTTSPGTNGVRAVSAGTLILDDVRIYGFSNAGVASEPSHLKARTIIEDSSIHDNGAYGVFARAATGGNLRTTIEDSRIDDNGIGVLASAAYGPTKVRVLDSTITDSGQDAAANLGIGLWAAGASAVIRVGDSRIAGNKTGLYQTNSGAMLSYGGNIVDDNTTNGNFTGSVDRK